MVRTRLFAVLGVVSLSVSASAQGPLAIPPPKPQITVCVKSDALRRVKDIFARVVAYADTTGKCQTDFWPNGFRSDRITTRKT